MSTQSQAGLEAGAGEPERPESPTASVSLGALAQQISEQLSRIGDQYHRLILVVGRHRTGKTAALNEIASVGSWPLVNVNLVLSESLIDLTSTQRALKVVRLMSDHVRDLDSNVVLLDNLEILFNAAFQLDPLRLLQGLSRNHTLIATWPGGLVGEALTYAEPGHPEYQRYANPEAVIVDANPKSGPIQSVENGESS